jgi:UDP-N-acetylmuramyl pentapeptide phosphotransferase/UDP-N-acetylglucosamine-1-phosphate transferase
LQNEWWSVALAIAVAWLFTGAVVRYAHLHEHVSADHDLDGVQKFHSRPVPRVGGLGIAAALVAAMLVGAWQWGLGLQALWVLVAAVPAFTAGLAEDLTKRVSVLARLFATMASAALGVWLLGAALNRVGIPVLDGWLSSLAFLSVVLTLVAVAGLANAVNIIDGFNGLSAGATSLMFAAFAYVAWQVNDPLVLHVCLAMIGGLMGFAVWNWPRGHIFLGDGGAYLVGFVLAEVAVLLVVRHPGVSPWLSLLVCAYPVTETLFSIYRKRVVRGMSPGLPDRLHLHMLVYRRLLSWGRGMDAAQGMTRRNSATSPYLWVLTLLAVVPAVLLWQQPAMLVVACIAFGLVYVGLYKMIVRFRTPHWLHRQVGS